jgi:hypothetical protein
VQSSADRAAHSALQPADWISAAVGPQHGVEIEVGMAENAWPHRLETLAPAVAANAECPTCIAGVANGFIARNLSRERKGNKPRGIGGPGTVAY